MRVKGTQKVWTFRIVDETKVPRQFCEISDLLIRAAVRAGVRAIEGVEIYEETRIAIK